MPCPKRKSSRSRRDSRSANKGLEVKTFTTCPNSGAPVMPHTVCLASGYYKGVKVLETKEDRRARRSQKAQAAQARQESKMKSAQTEHAQGSQEAQ